jgi:hypothetical protein
VAPGSGGKYDSGMRDDASMESVRAAIERGHACLRDGQLDEAESAYREVLARVSDHPVAMHFLGAVALRRCGAATPAPRLISCAGRSCWRRETGSFMRILVSR